MSHWKDRITGQGKESPDQLLANPNNWRKHPKYQQEALKGVLEDIGWIQQVIVNQTTGHLIDGHLRVELSQREGETEVPVIYVDLTEEEEKLALATIDPLSALAETDQAMLDELIADIDTDNEQLNELLNSLSSLDLLDEPTEGLADDDDVPDVQNETVSREGDIWLLGDHRLMCGNSTNLEHVERLVDNQLVDMVWTDPPYNVDYEGKTKESLKIDNDSMGDSQFRQFLRDLFTSAFTVTKEGGPIYVAHADTEGVNFRLALQEAGFYLKQVLIWVKSSSVMGRQDYHWQHEPILYGWKPGAAHVWHGERNKKTVIDEEPKTKDLDKNALAKEIKELRNRLCGTVIREDKPNASREHPTMKPVELIVSMVRNSSKRGDSVLDLCGGSGSTLIACEKLGRSSRVMELDPHYCDVIIRRWQKFSGQEAVLESSRQSFGQVENG